MLVILLSGLAIAVSLPLVVLGGECLLAMLPLRRDRRAERGNRPSLVVVVPAHNEEAGIADTINAVWLQLGPRDRLLVVADNCDDQTAEISRSLSATVLERTDAECRGKGYAIRNALDHLLADPPEVIVCIDADCIPLPSCIERIARASFASGRPIQAAYVMQPPENASPGTLVSALAVLVKNYVRPRGLQRLRLPCLITGSGVAYPWEVLQQVPHPKSHIVEDMHFSVDLALAGFAPLPCMEAVIESKLPDAQAAAYTQRTRWEQGHLSVILSQGPRLLIGAVRQRSFRLFALSLELMVPPLSLLMSVVAASVVALLLVGVLAATWLPWWLLLTGVGIGMTGLFVAWWRFGRCVLPPKMLIRVPRYVVGKLSIYTKFLTSPEQSWIRTSREPAASVASKAPAGPHFDRPQTPAEKTSPAD